MLKTFVYGAIAAFVGSKLIKMNEEGRLEPYKERARARANELKERLAEQRQSAEGRASSANQSAARKSPKLSPNPDVSKPAAAHPWPVDSKAMPS